MLKDRHQYFQKIIMCLENIAQNFQRYLLGQRDEIQKLRVLPLSADWPMSRLNLRSQNQYKIVTTCIYAVSKTESLACNKKSTQCEHVLAKLFP